MMRTIDPSTALLAEAQPWLECLLAAQGDAADPALIALQHKIAAGRPVAKAAEQVGRTESAFHYLRQQLMGKQLLTPYAMRALAEAARGWFPGGSWEVPDVLPKVVSPARRSPAKAAAPAQAEAPRAQPGDEWVEVCRARVDTGWALAVKVSERLPRTRAQERQYIDVRIALRDLGAGPRAWLVPGRRVSIALHPRTGAVRIRAVADAADGWVLTKDGECVRFRCTVPGLGLAPGWHRYRLGEVVGEAVIYQPITDTESKAA